MRIHFLFFEGWYSYTRDLYFLLSIETALALSKVKKSGFKGQFCRGTQATHSVSLGLSFLFCKDGGLLILFTHACVVCQWLVLIPSLSRVPFSPFAAQAGVAPRGKLPRAVSALPAACPSLGFWTLGVPTLEFSSSHHFGGKCVLMFYSPLQNVC